MALSRERRDELSRTQAALTGLTKHPSWPVFVREHVRKIERLQREARIEALSSRGANQRQLDYWRGFIDSLRWQMTMPQVAERNLIRWLRSQGVEIEEEEEDETYV